MRPRHPDLQRRWFPESSARRLTLVYFTVALAWITISDGLFELVARDTQWGFIASLGKAWLFVGVTSVLLYLALARLQARNRQAARLLVESEYAYRAMFANNPSPMWVYDTDTLRFLAVNEAALRRYGYSRGQFLRMTLYDLHPFERRAELDQVLAASRGQVLHGAFASHRTYAGDELEVEVTSHTIYFAGVEARLVLAQDVTHRLRAERALQHSQSQLREAQRIAGLGAWSRDIDSGQVEWSEQTRAILGVAADVDPSYDTFISLIHPEDVGRVLAAHGRASYGDSLEIEHRICRPDGELRHVTEHAELVRDQGGRRLVGTIADVTERKRAERALAQANERLSRLSSQVEESAEQERRHIARELHDDVGQLLTFAKMTSSWLLRRQQDDECRQRASTLPAVIGEALEKVRNLALTLRPAQLDQHGLDAAMRAHLERYLADMAISWELQCDPLEPRPDGTLEIALFRIFQEAVTNAIKHSGATRITVTLRAARARLILTVRDDGCGFDQDEVLRRGSSLGLLTMRERAHLVDGTLTLTSQPGVGTAVIVEVPHAATTLALVGREQQHG